MNIKILKNAITNYELTMIIANNQDRKHNFKYNLIMEECYLYEKKLKLNEYEIQSFFLKDSFSSKAVFLIDYETYHKKNILSLIKKINKIGGKPLIISSNFKSALIFSTLFKSSKLIKF